MADDILRRKIREGLERTGFSMRELSDRAGMNPTGLQQIMSGRSKNPRLDTLRRIAYVLGDDPRTYIEPMRPKEFFVEGEKALRRKESWAAMRSAHDQKA